ncbi:TetR/AcrR family transcriptional regulator [Lusitaniella coriacea LEGE 07157]|uniref:TetR/AcrR family transcriptional regulator n=1 Tax=Lusitaniella coriacea LEGE 07157 TaxID=945747 RepID=A0A8J7DW72_9CYAN|nr:TetR/AcrR family transcriptional regulator [Lusitaniella coriacea]MBE9115908.1 TetR/AcrR family transcriptional regulator [Lusitaniella coriacea LEGE 07157]
MSPKIVDKEQKRLEIVEAALQVFGRKGYQGSRMSDIAQEAGIGKGTIYEYFNSKDELILAIFEGLTWEYEQLLNQLAESSQPPLEAILGSLTQLLEEVDEYADLTPVCLELWGSRLLSESLGLREKMSDWFERLSAAYARLIVKGQQKGTIHPEIDAKALARTLVSMIDGILLHYGLFRPSPSFFSKQEKELERMVRRALQL